MVRHGETEFNKLHIFQGDCDSPLTAKGVDYATRLAIFCAEVGVNKIYSSNASRNLHTVFFIVTKENLTVKIDNLLREICYGEWEEKSHDEVKDSPFYIQREEDKYNFIHPGTYKTIRGESYSDAFQRWSLFYTQLINECNVDDVILVVTHLGIMRAAKKFFENISEESAATYNFSNNTAYVIDFSTKKVVTREIKI